MSELLDHAKTRRHVLKHLILQLHQGKAPEEVKPQLVRLLGRVPYSEVVEVEQELIAEGMPTEEILRLCDLHSAALKGALDSSTKQTAPPPPGHPVHTFNKENEAVLGELALMEKLFDEIAPLTDETDGTELVGQIRVRFGRLTDIEKHYRRKENLLFPFLEKKGITGPPTVMWGKDDEVRESIKAALATLEQAKEVSVAEVKGLIELVFRPSIEAIREMVFKEEEILFPMCLDKLTAEEWYSIYRQSPEIGFCIYDPPDEWKPAGVEEIKASSTVGEKVVFPTGSLTPTELNALLNTIPFDLTFVDAEDTVRYFTKGRERIFDRNRAIIGRKVQMCHPPSSVHIVQQIIDDFKNGKESSAPFWINLHDRFIHIEYFALRDEHGKYLGTLEVSQDLTEKRALTGEQRLLTYLKD